MDKQLIDVVCDGSMTALAAIIREKGLTLTDAQLDAVLAALRESILAEYEELVAVGKDALNMGEAVLKTLVNTACTSAAVKAMQNAGLLAREEGSK